MSGGVGGGYGGAMMVEVSDPEADLRAKRDADLAALQAERERPKDQGS